MTSIASLVGHLPVLQYLRRFLFTDPVADETVLVFERLVHSDHLRLLAVAFIACARGRINDEYRNYKQGTKQILDHSLL